MSKTLLLFALFCGAAAAQSAAAKTEAPKPAPVRPVSDLLRLEIARTQRDLLLADAKIKEAVERYNAARLEAEALQKTLIEKITQAGHACGENRSFDAGKLVCVEAPAASAGDK